MIANTPSNSRKGRQTSNGHRLSFLLWLVVGVAIIVGVALSWLFLHNNADAEDSVKESKQQKRIKAVLPAPKSSNPVEAKKETKVQSDEDAERTRRREMFSKMTTDEKIEYLREQIKNTPIPETPMASPRAKLRPSAQTYSPTPVRSTSLAGCAGVESPAFAGR